MDIGTRIKIERERKGWTQEEMASRCGYKYKSSISKIESSGDDISSKKIKIASEALGVPVSYLMGWEDKADTDHVYHGTYQYTSSIGHDMLFKSADGATEDELIQTANYLNYLKSKRKD